MRAGCVWNWSRSAEGSVELFAARLPPDGLLPVPAAADAPVAASLAVLAVTFPPDLFHFMRQRRKAFCQRIEFRRQERRWRAERKGTGRLCLVTPEP